LLQNSFVAQTGRFLVNLIFDPEYPGYVADVPQLPGCMSQGRTVEAALRNARKAIVAYLKATRIANSP
jgi:predicted RNase H-like HicB family nuclease